MYGEFWRKLGRASGGTPRYREKRLPDREKISMIRTSGVSNAGIAERNYFVFCWFLVF